MNRYGWILVVFCGLMVLSAVVSGLLRQVSPTVTVPPPKDMPSRFAPRQLPVSENNPAREFSNAIADAVEKVMPSVVVIRTEKIAAKEQRVLLDPLGINYYTRIVPEQLKGEGSGVIIHEHGYVMTSWHVIDGAGQIDVVLNDGTKLPATPVGHDAASDLAVLKIKADGITFPAVEFGDSDSVRVGDVSIAIGSPFSLQSSVTVGHVSQKGVRVQILPYEDFIQTDAAINEGNSGGPLIDVDGRLIGINAAVKTEAEKRGVGIAFAVPSNLAMIIAKSLIETGVHEWPWVGAFFYTVEAPFRQSIFDGASVVVAQVWNGTAADRAGFRPGDLVLEVDGVEVKSKYDVDRIIFSHAVGDEVRFLIRQGETEPVEVNLLLEEYPALTP